MLRKCSMFCKCYKRQAVETAGLKTEPLRGPPVGSQDPCLLHPAASPAVGVAGGAVPQAAGAVPKVPQVSNIGAEVDSALKGHRGVHQSRGGGREPVGDNSPLHLDAVGLRGHTADPVGSLDHHSVPAGGAGEGAGGPGQREKLHITSKKGGSWRSSVGVIGAPSELPLPGDRGVTRLTSLFIVRRPHSHGEHAHPSSQEGRAQSTLVAEQHLDLGRPGSKAHPPRPLICVRVQLS